MSHPISLADKFAQDPGFSKLLHQEEVVLEVTEMICELMENQGVTRTRLASLLGKTKGYVSQLLDGETNMTLKTLADIMFAMNCRLAIHAVAADSGAIVYESDGWSQIEFVPGDLDQCWTTCLGGSRESQLSLAG